MASSYKSIAPKDSEGNRRLLSKYGGGSKGPRQPYATGGAVKRAAGGMVNMDDEDDMPDDGSGGMPDMSAEGDSAPPRLDRPGRKMHGKDKGKDAKDKKGGTNVNVIIMPPGGAPGGPPPPGGPMPPMMAGPPPGPPPGPPMLPPGLPPGAGPGGPPMGMHKNGGRVGRAMGGKVHSDAAEDMAMMAKMAPKGQKMTKFSKGGSVAPVDMDAGAGGALGRLEKIKKYGK